MTATTRWPAEHWYGVGAAGRPMVAHRLRLAVDPAKQYRTSICGQERRRSWQRLDSFAEPAAFTLCQDCDRVGHPPAEVSR